MSGPPDDEDFTEEERELMQQVENEKYARLEATQQKRNQEMLSKQESKENGRQDLATWKAQQDSAREKKKAANN